MSANYKRSERVSQAQSVVTLASRRAAQKAVVASQAHRSAYRQRIDAQLAATARTPVGRETVI